MVPMIAVEAIATLFRSETVRELAVRTVAEYDCAKALRGDDEKYRLALEVVERTHPPLKSKFEIALINLRWDDRLQEGSFDYAGMYVALIPTWDRATQTVTSYSLHT